jgi:hypothetical protein
METPSQDPVSNTTAKGQKEKEGKKEKPEVAVHACNPSYWEVKIGRIEDLGQLRKT